jgi:hypothetical protein
VRGRRRHSRRKDEVDPFTVKEDEIDNPFYMEVLIGRP